MKFMLLLFALIVGCSNVWASNNVSTVSTKFSGTGNVTSNFTQTGNFTEAAWNLAVTWKSSAYWGNLDGTKGSQIGSGSNPATSIVLTGSSIPGTISSVVVNTSGASSISATVAVTVGGTTFKCNNNNTASLTSSAANYTFSGSGSGNVVLTWTNSSDKAIYIKSVTITYTAGTSYSVSYNAGTGSGTAPTDGTAYYNGSTVTVKERGEVTHATLGFRGWTDGVNTYNPGETFTMGTSNVTLTAVWTTKCTFAYDGNGNTGGAVPSSGYYADYGEGAKIKVVGNTGSLVKVVGSTPYIWNGWNTAANGSGTPYVANDEFNISENTKLYAQWRELATYTLVTDVKDIVPGKHYIIASAKKDATTYPYAMGSQNANYYRNYVTIPTDDFADNQITEVDGLYEFVISGDATNKWTIYDISCEPNGYMYAPTVSSNYIKMQNSITDEARWDISFSSSVASITAVAKNNSDQHRSIKYNSGTPRFSTYTSDQQAVYLYKKDTDPGTSYYSPTTVSSSQTITTPTTIGKGGVLDMGSNALSISGDGSLTIEDGGQLITTSAVNATIEKNITAASKDIADHWYTIASPVNAPEFDEVTNLIDDEEYDLYRYDEPTFTWQNSKKDIGGGVHQFTSFENGRGYLYRKAGSETIKYVGTINTGDLEDYALLWASTNADLKGLNLIGNPFPHNIYKGVGGAIYDTKLSDKFYYLENNGTWQVGTYTTAIKPGMGIIVQTNSGGNITIKDDATPATAEHAAKANNDEIMLMVSNSQYKDVAYAVFGDRYGLKKIEHRSAEAPMLYIPQNNRRYAVAMMSNDTKSFNLNFKAMTMGSYTLSYKSKGEFNYVHVIDRLTGEDIDMLQGEYNFIATPGDNENRFVVRLGYMPNNEGAENEIFAYQNGKNILISGEGELQVFDVTGRMIATQHVNGVETINLQSQGIYIFKLNEKVQKIVVR